MNEQQLEQAFEEYWKSRTNRGYYSQFEDKYDAAHDAWIDGWKKGRQSIAVHEFRVLVQGHDVPLLIAAASLDEAKLIAKRDGHTLLE